MRKSQYYPFQCWMLNKGTTGTIFIKSLVWRGPWLEIEPRTSSTWSQLPLGYRGGSYIYMILRLWYFFCFLEIDFLYFIFYANIIYTQGRHCGGMGLTHRFTLSLLYPSVSYIWTHWKHGVYICFRNRQ